MKTKLVKSQRYIMKVYVDGIDGDALLTDVIAVTCQGYKGCIAFFDAEGIKGNVECEYKSLNCVYRAVQKQVQDQLDREIAEWNAK